MTRTKSHLCALAAGLASVILMEANPVGRNRQSLSDSTASRSAVVHVSHSGSCLDTPPDSYTMFVPLSHVRYFGAADLMLNNRGAAPHAVKTTWYLTNGTIRRGRQLDLPAQQMHFIDVLSVLPAGIALDGVAGLELEYTGRIREVWAQVVLKPASGAFPEQTLDALFTMDSDFKTASLNAVWAKPQGGARVILAVANTSGAVLTVNVAAGRSAQTLRLAPHTVEDLILKGRDLEQSVFAQAVRSHLEHRVLEYKNKTVVFD